MNDIMLISGGTLIDGTGSDPKPNQGILIEGTRILSVGKQAAVMAKDRSGQKIVEIDASKKTVMPGLIDSHLHCSFDDVQSNETFLS